MKRYDVILLHPPAIYDFRERPAFFGPLADVVPSSPIFEMYPVGFVTLASHLRRHGIRTRIVNLALLMMRDREFDVERFLRSLRPRLFGIDLHWLPHVHGGLAVASVLKRLHPDIPIVFGGISSTYFHEELIRYEQVDFVLRGSVCEPALVSLVSELAGAGDFSRVSNLVWKDGSEVRVNHAVPVERRLEDYGVDLGMMIREVVGRADLWSSIPFHAWWRHPITAVFTVRGCDHGCVTCGAADAAFRRIMVDRHPIRRSPAGIAVQVRQLATLTRAPIFLVGDIQDGGEDYVNAVVDALAATPVSNRVIFEFFVPPARSLVERIDHALPHWGVELSPESHDERVRALLDGEGYTNAEMEASIEAMMSTRCENVDLFFMIGLPGQTYENVLEGTDYVAALFERFDRRLNAFITPMGPFLDPGSDAFEHAEQLGYRRFAQTLEEHRQLLENRSWEQMLSYETVWMSRSRLVDATYDAAERLNEARMRTGRTDRRAGEAVAERIAASRDLRSRLHPTGATAPDLAIEKALNAEVIAMTDGMVQDKRELFPPGGFLRQFRLTGIMRLLWQDFTRRAPT
jgi:B12-binding domain/radical SAM domain protein